MMIVAAAFLLMTALIIPTAVLLSAEAKEYKEAGNLTGREETGETVQYRK